jgi:hypothetical protein
VSIAVTGGVLSHRNFKAMYGSGLLHSDVDGILELVLLLSLAVAGLCVMALVAMLVVGRLRHAVRQRERNRRRAL